MTEEHETSTGVTELLHAWNEGDVEALKDLMPMPCAAEVQEAGSWWRGRSLSSERECLLTFGGQGLT